jgi:hypothetical protein
MRIFLYSQHTNPGVESIIKKLRAERLYYFDGMRFGKTPTPGDVVVYWGLVGPKLPGIITLNSTDKINITPGKLIAYVPPLFRPQVNGDYTHPDLGYRCNNGHFVQDEATLHAFGKKVFLAGAKVSNWGSWTINYKTFTSSPGQRRITLETLRKAGLLFGAVSVGNYIDMTVVRSVNTGPVLSPRYARMYGTRIANYIEKHYSALQQEAA